ncbi:BLUF domain-containing protein [Reichenbachiella ulvae]|uniref:BLUF domain-containing protein n=1 Tax=Reichenbachiella ulvae TaxID=2980104 RepID=A0ABT3CRI6_9BACT|nr:BLUF domain-containing protein [Reichenbachiella ulvae]MCV9386227.1 BLUF domain-containing protein [Reichenbachiella ulvae]
MREKLQQELAKIIRHADVKLLKILYASAKVYLEETKKEEENSQLHRMVYTSSRAPNCNEEAIEQILEASRRNNKPLGITGLLVHTEMRFLQILEGSKNTVLDVYNRIQEDPRHRDSEIKYFEPVDERYFSDWHMGSKNIEKDSLEFDTQIAAEENEIYQAMLEGDRSAYKDESMKALKTFMILT